MRTCADLARCLCAFSRVFCAINPVLSVFIVCFSLCSISTYNDEKSAAAMYDAVNNIGFDLWKATANGDKHTYDIRVTREQARMYSVCCCSASPPFSLSQHEN